MKIYFAGYTAHPQITTFATCFLDSYLAFNKNPRRLIGQVTKYNIKDFFLDSGAFSAFTRNATINIDEYIDFCLQVKDYVKVIANLDVIGDNQKTYENWRYIRSKEVNALPVIQYGANEKYFDLYLKEHNERYIALGGLVPYARKKEELKNWLDYCFHKIKEYWPVKTHLFGTTTAWVLKNYPAYSCDGTTWLQGGKFGVTLEYKSFSIKPRKLSPAYKDATNYKYKGIKNAELFVKLEKQITDLWELRGIKWD